MNHEIKDIVSDALGAQRERHKRQLAEALGYGAQESVYLGTWDDLISIVVEQTRQLAKIRQVVL